jgi:hypothetical protein
MEGDEICVTIWGLAMLGYKLDSDSESVSPHFFKALVRYYRRTRSYKMLK